MGTRMGLVLGSVLLLGACGTATGSGDTAGTTDAGSEVSSSTSAQPSQTAGTAESLSFTGTTIDGEPFKGSELSGKPAVLWFWAPWCPTCRSQVPAVEAIADDFEGEVAVVAVGGLSDQSAITDFARGVEGPTHLVDVEGQIWRHFGISAQSTYVLLNAQGEVVDSRVIGNEELPDVVANLAG